jgi:hypothetical protein
MKQIRLSYLFILFYIFESGIVGVETGLRPVSTQTTTDTNTTLGNGLKPFHSTTPETKSRIAFLVGINSYKATTSLKYAVGDSDAIEDLLLKTGKYDKLIKLNDYGKITTTLNPETQSYSSQRIKMAPTKANIEATYLEILATNPDTLLFYYSGHGFIEGEGGENFIAPKDVDVKFEKKKVGQVEKEVPIPLNGISLKVMGVQAAKVKRVVFLIDACRSPLPEADGEDSKKGEKALSATSKIENEKEESSNIKEILLRQNLLSAKTDKLPKRVLEAEGITMLIGAAPEVSSLEDEDFKSGIFTHFLKKAFNGGVQEENQEEYITEENLSRYIEDRFKQYYELRKKESELAAEPKLYNLTFDRGKKGEILISQHRPIEGKERIDKPIYTDKIRKREVKGKLVYNEKGEREDLRFFVHDKKRDLYYPDSLDGVYKMEYSFNKDKSGELEKFTATEFNLENEEVFEYGTRLIPNVGWEYKGIYNASDTATDLTADNQKDNHRKDVYRKDLINQVPTMVLTSADKEKIRFEKKIFDFNGNVISEEYFDANGKPLEFDGVAKIVRSYDKYGQVVLEEFYSKETYDEYGDILEQGKLVAKDGFARYKAKYKSKGNLLYETWEDAEGNIANTQSGYAKTKYIYDKYERLIRKKFYDLENKPANDKWGVSVYSYSYNPDCIQFYESKIVEIVKRENKQALTDWKLGKYKLCLAEEIHEDKIGKPSNDESQIYKKVRIFNKKGYLVSEENFRGDGRRHLENGVAKVEYAHDKDGNIISRKNYGEFEVNKKPVPVSDGNGVHEYKYIYQEYFSYDGKPILNECMYHSKDKGLLLEPYGCALKVEHFGIDGKPIEDKREVFRTNIYYTGVSQEEADRHYYSLNARIISIGKKINSTTNPFGNKTLEVEIETKEGKENIVSKREIKYDERNNVNLDAFYILEGGKEVLDKKIEYKTNDRKKVTHSATYKIKEGKEVLEEKYETKYDERNNATLAVVYKIVDGKEVPSVKRAMKYDLRNNQILDAYFITIDGVEVLDKKSEFKFDERNNRTLFAYYETRDDKEVLIEKREFEFDNKNNRTQESEFKLENGREVLLSKTKFIFDERNNQTKKATFNYKEGQEVLAKIQEWKYDDKNNKTQELKYETKEGKEILIDKKEYKFDSKNNKTFEANFKTRDGKEVLIDKKEFEFDERNNKTLETKYITKNDKVVLADKKEYKYDKNNNKTLEVIFNVDEDGNAKIDWKKNFQYDEKNNKTLEILFKAIDSGIEIPVLKDQYKYDERNNKTLELKYRIQEGKEILISKTEYKFDEKNNVTFYALYTGEDETIQEKNTADFRLQSFSEVTKYEPQIKEIEAQVNKTKDEFDKNALTKKLEILKKDYEAKKKKYTLTEEKFGENEKLESASYKLLFFNPRGPAEKRLMRVDLDLFYRPVKVGFEEE